MKRYFKMLVSCACICCLSINSAFASNTKISLLNDRLLAPLKYDIINQSGTLIMQYSELFSSMGAEVSFNEYKQTITASLDGDTIVIYLNNDYATFNGEKIEISKTIIDDEVYLPVRKICELFGFEVAWDMEKSQVSLTKESEGYLFLKTKSDGAEIADFDTLLEKALANNTNFANITDTCNYLEKLKKDYKQNLTDTDPNDLGINTFPVDGSDSVYIDTDELSYLDSSLSILRTIKSTDSQLQNQKINQQIIEDSVSYSIVASFLSIKEVELDIQVLEAQIENENLNLQNCEAKYRYGLISEQALSSVKSNLETLNANLQTLQDNLEVQKNVLKSILGTSRDIYFDIDIEVDYSDFEEIQLQTCISTAKSKDLSIQILQNELEVCEYNLSTNFDATATEKTKLRNEVYAAQRAIDDQKESLEQGLTSTYTTLKSLYNQKETLNTALEQAITDYNTAVSNYNAGEITLYDLKNAELSVMNCEKNLEESGLNFYLYLYKFNTPHLNA